MSEPIGRRERKRQQTLDHLADTAWAMFESQGYDAVTMESVAEAADVAKGTLYKHFPVKEALLRHYFHREFRAAQADILRQLEALPSFEQRLRFLLSRHAQWSESRRPYLGPYFTFRMRETQIPHCTAPELRSGLDRMFTVMIEAAQSKGEITPRIAAADLAYRLEFLFLSAVLHWLSRTDLDLRQEFDLIVDLFLNGAGEKQ